LRELFKTIELFRIGQARSHSAESQRSTCFRLAHKLPKPLRLAGKIPGSCNGLFLVGIKRDALRHSQTSLRTSFPSSLIGQALNRPPGSSTAHFQLSKSSTGYAFLQVAANSTNPARCLVATDSEYLPVGFRATPLLWEKAGFCGKSACGGLKWRRMRPVSTSLRL
jgi:hypothetical protein